MAKWAALAICPGGNPLLATESCRASLGGTEKGLNKHEAMQREHSLAQQLRKTMGAEGGQSHSHGSPTRIPQRHRPGGHSSQDAPGSCPSTLCQQLNAAAHPWLWSGAQGPGEKRRQPQPQERACWTDEPGSSPGHYQPRGRI